MEYLWAKVLRGYFLSLPPEQTWVLRDTSFPYAETGGPPEVSGCRIWSVWCVVGVSFSHWQGCWVEYVWNTYGMSMEYVGHIYGISMEYLWDM